MVAVVFAALAAAASLAFPSFTTQAPYSFYFLAVIAVVWYSRATGPAVGAIVLGSIAAQFTTHASTLAATPSPSPIARFIAFAILASVVVFFTRALQSARHHAEHLASEYDEQRERLQVTLSSIGDAVVASDVNGRITYLNPIAEQLTGWSGAAARGRPVDEVFRILHEETRTPINSPLSDTLLTGQSVRRGHPSILIARDGLERSIDDTAAPIRDRHGRVAGAILVFRDVTERRLAHDALREADRRKDEFLATLAHELRNPLAPMRTALHIMQRHGPPDAEWQRAREIVDRQTRQMTRLIDDLLDVSRVTQGRLVLQRQTTALHTVLQHAIETVRPLMERQRHALRVNLSSPLVIDGDPARLTQIFANLLDNAAKYQDPGGVVDLSVEVRGEQALVTVRDEGLGMTPEQRARVFEMFAQVDSGVDRSQGGLGIGLSLVKRLTELHGGSVSAESAGLGHGSTFVVSLPIARDVSVDAGTLSSLSVLPSVPNRRVLVVDDNQDAAYTVARLLELQGHTVQMAYDGEDALRAAERWKPEVVLLDIGLPALNGYDVCRQLRAQPWARGITIAALTGWGQAADRDRAEAAGFDRHLVKPVDPDLLIQMMR